MTTKVPMKRRATQLAPAAAVKGAYDLALTAEARERLKEINEIQAYATDQARLASKVSITDDASDQKAAELTVNLTKARKGLSELQKYFTSPFEKAKKGIIATFKKLGEDAQGQEDRLRREAESYFMKKENERREAERNRLEAEQEAQRKARGLGRAAPKPLATAPTPEVQRSTETEHGSRGITMVWGFDVTDPSKVPSQYKKVDESLIRAAVNSGVREIPGVLISERPRSAVR